MGDGWDPARLQREAARRGLGAFRAPDAQRDGPGALAQGRRGRAAGERSGGVHARRRVHPRADRRARLLGRGRILCSRPGRRRRHGQARRRVDRQREARAGRLGDGLAPFRRALRQPRVHAVADTRGVLDLLRRQVPRARAKRRPAASAVTGLSALEGDGRCLR